MSCFSQLTLLFTLYLWPDKIRIGNIFLTAQSFTSKLFFCYAMVSFFNEYFCKRIECYVDAKFKEVADEDCLYSKQLRANGVLYYMWVPILFLFQAVFFRRVCRLWKEAEGGVMSALVQRVPTLPLSAIKNTSNKWAAGLFATEVILWLHLFFQIFTIRAFIGPQFDRLGYSWLYDSTDLNRVFPEESQCTILYYRDGTPMELVLMCGLPLNKLNRVLFIGAWWWVVTLVVCGLTTLGVRLALSLRTPLTMSSMVPVLLLCSYRSNSFRYSAERLLRELTFREALFLDTFLSNLSLQEIVDTVLLLSTQTQTLGVAPLPNEPTSEAPQPRNGQSSQKHEEPTAPDNPPQKH